MVLNFLHGVNNTEFILILNIIFLPYMLSVQLFFKIHMLNLANYVSYDIHISIFHVKKLLSSFSSVLFLHGSLCPIRDFGFPIATILASKRP